MYIHSDSALYAHCIIVYEGGLFSHCMAKHHGISMMTTAVYGLHLTRIALFCENI